jgi:hypothetical protein
MGFLKGFLLTVVTIGLLACGNNSPVPAINDLNFTNEGSLSGPVKLTPGAVTSAHVGKGTSYYYAVVSPNTTYTVTAILTTLDNVALRVHKGSFSSPIACTSDTGGSKEECSVAMTAPDTSIYMEVVNDNTVLGTPFTIWVH